MSVGKMFGCPDNKQLVPMQYPCGISDTDEELYGFYYV